jgi:hypothetical protein
MYSSIEKEIFASVSDETGIPTFNNWQDYINEEFFNWIATLGLDEKVSRLPLDELYPIYLDFAITRSLPKTIAERDSQRANYIVNPKINPSLISLEDYDRLFSDKQIAIWHAQHYHVLEKVREVVAKNVD